MCYHFFFFRMRQLYPVFSCTKIFSEQSHNVSADTHTVSRCKNHNINYDKKRKYLQVKNELVVFQRKIDVRYFIILANQCSLPTISQLGIPGVCRSVMASKPFGI